MIQDSLSTYYETLITDIKFNSTNTAILVSRVNPLNNTEHEFIPPLLSFAETNPDSINYIAGKPIDKTVPDVTQYEIQPHDRVIHDELTGVTYINKDGTLYILRDKPIDNAFIRVPQFKVNRLYRGMSVVRFTNNRMYMSTKPTRTIPLSGGNDWIEVTEMDLFIARCEVDAESLSGSLVVDFLSDLSDGSNVIAHYPLSNDSVGDSLANYTGVVARTEYKALTFLPDKTGLRLDHSTSGIKLPQELVIHGLNSASVRFTLDVLPQADDPVFLLTQGNTTTELCFRVFLKTTTGEVAVEYRTVDGDTITTITSGTMVTTATEYSLVYSISNEYIRVYLDDSMIIDHTLPTPIAITPLAMYVAAKLVDSASFEGSIRDIRVYDNPLSLEEVREVYNYGN